MCVYECISKDKTRPAVLAGWTVDGALLTYLPQRAVQTMTRNVSATHPGCHLVHRLKPVWRQAGKICLREAGRPSQIKVCLTPSCWVIQSPWASAWPVFKQTHTPFSAAYFHVVFVSI